MKFIADSMLGRLAKWLRLLGFDTIYYPEIENSLLLRIAKEQGRLVLTRDTSLIKVRELKEVRPAPLRGARPGSQESGVEEPKKFFLLIDNDPFEQLKAVVTHFNLKNFSLMHRCVECNSLLQRVSKMQVQGSVPEYVFLHSDLFNKCPGCGRIYWHGSHPQKIKDKLKEILSKK
ncbi:MAG: Mut7-C RNAse domain-containing protein [Nitrospirae bacterium]|nr:Mut7-C RNAse domain-containing protein [Nitrospirota bacterium]